MRTHATKHATNRVGKAILKNCQVLENVLGISSFPSPISRFPSPKIQFSSPKIQFSSHEIRFTQIGFLLSSTAFRFLQWLSDFLEWLSAFSNSFSNFSNSFPIFLNGFPLSKKSEKSIYGEKYTKDRYSSFVFFATRSPSFVITAKQYLHLTQQRLVSFFHVEVISHTTHTQNTVNMLVHCENMMNHGGRCHTTAAIVPHPRLREVKKLANMLCNKARTLTINNIIINNTY
jgi:hypothetical protein